MGDTASERSTPTHFMGSEIRGGKIFAQNSGCNVEDRYPTAYNLGSGRAHWAGWINVDLNESEADLQCDLRSLAVESDSADAVAAIHVLEHFYQWEAEEVLTEWRRILKPGGKMILELPCMDKVLRYIGLCIEKKEPLQDFMTAFALWGDPKYKDPAMCHRWGWSMKQLHDVMENVGMREIEFVEPRYHFKFRDMRVEAIK